MKVVLLPAALLAALALPAAGQVQLVQTAPAEIGTSMPLLVTGATPNATIFLTGSVRLGPLAGATSGAPPGGPGLFHMVLGTTTGLGSLSAGVALPPSTSLLGKLLPMRAIDLGAYPGAGALSNPLAAWIGPHPISISPAPELYGAYGWSLAPGFGIVCGSVTAYPGTSLVPTAYVAESELHPWTLATGDVDGDGRDEIAVGHPGGSPMFISGAGAFLLSE